MAMEKKITAGRTLSFYKFFDHHSGEMRDSIWDLLEDGLWQDFSIDNFLYNESVGDMKPEYWNPVFPHITPIGAGFRWDAQRQCVKLDYYHPRRIEDADMSTFLAAAECFFSRYEGKKIGVHLSGGLDTSLIIGLLRHFHIPFVLAGLKSDRFEMRTERHIQQILGVLGEETFLLDIEETPSFSHLERVPKHQVPCEFIRGNEADKVLAQVFCSAGVEVVFTGQGGDSLLMEDESHGLAQYNIGYEFLTPWSAEMHYKPLGIDLVSPLADTEIIDQISNLRLGQAEDTSKLWARHFFRDFLPRELSEYCYVADFFGLTLDGLDRAKTTIESLFEECNDLVHHHVFSPTETRKLLNTSVYSFDIKEYIDFCARISVAVWYHALFRKA